jgi:hypothetical protein
VPRSTAMSRPRNVSALLIGNGTFRGLCGLETVERDRPEERPSWSYRDKR